MVLMVVVVMSTVLMSMVVEVMVLVLVLLARLRPHTFLPRTNHILQYNFPVHNRV